MITALLGKKIGMSQIFKEDSVIPVTLIEAGPCYILEIKEVNGKKKVTLGFLEVKETKVKKPQLGFFKKIGVKPLKYIKEFYVDSVEGLKIGQKVGVEIFKDIKYVDVTGRSKGRGFSGGMKRWGWSGGPDSHGSTSHRRIGSAGATTDPGRVWPGHHMPGRYGFEKVTVQNLEVVRIEPEDNLLFVKGAVPGARNTLLIIRKAKKK